MRGPGHRGGLCNDSHSGLSPKPVHPPRDPTGPVTECPHRRATGTGHHHRDTGQEALSDMPKLCARPVEAYAAEDSDPGPQRSRSCLKENKSPLPAAAAPLSSSLKGGRLAEAPTCLASLHLEAEAPAPEETLRPGSQLWVPSLPPASSGQTQPQTWKLHSEQRLQLQICRSAVNKNNSSSRSRSERVNF